MLVYAGRRGFFVAAPFNYGHSEVSVGCFVRRLVGCPSGVCPHTRTRSDERSVCVCVGPRKYSLLSGTVSVPRSALSSFYY